MLRIYIHKSLRHFKRLIKYIYHITYIHICIYIMSEDLNDFYSTDFNNWNYNEFINKTGIDFSL